MNGKQIVLGVSGSIAAYKVIEVARDLTRAGARVDTILTRAAQEFVTPLTFQSLTYRDVYTDLWAPNSTEGEEHIRLARRADLVAILPATADILAKLAHGLADDLLTTVILATRAPVLLAPAMDGDMYANAATQDNVALLRRRGLTVLEPEYGPLASGELGRGRLPEHRVLMGAIQLLLGRAGDLAGRRLVVTAGGTQEPIDPVRHISNRSSGKMGYAITEAALARGARVTLISAPVALPAPYGAEVVAVETAEQMRRAVAAACPDCEALIMAAAVADYRVARPAAQKIKKNDTRLTLELEPTADILAETTGDFLRVGFAAESQDLLANATQKLRRKRLHLIVANDITAPDAGFAVDTNRVLFLDGAAAEELPLLTKREVADRLLDRVRDLLVARPALRSPAAAP
jgi:phosphopantothenoylcysteine decarboxylase/phosphopantothenate--cysteine ligase